jgi:hypothetical protein
LSKTVEFGKKTQGILGVKVTIMDATTLPPKGLRVFFSKNAPNLPFLAQEAKMNFFHFFHFQP